MPADPRLLTPEQLAKTRKQLERFRSYACGHKLLDHIAALDQQRAEALLIAKTLPHSDTCESRYVRDETPWNTFTHPVCRSINGCGHCEKCRWREEHPDRHRYPCNCSRGLLIEKLGGKE